MSARKDTPEIENCKCGKVPTAHSQNAGAVFIYWIACDCGAATAKSEDYSAVLEEWITVCGPGGLTSVEAGPARLLPPGEEDQQFAPP